jgi:ABC-type branched-subunit amino acid transport system substrate-binding protein
MDAPSTRHSGQLRVGACLSLSGKYARFGRQAAQGLETWRSLGGAADLVIEDDRSDRHALEAALPGVAARSDLLLGPYSTQLMRTAGRIAADAGRLLWNHGGSGDDVEAAHPGHIVSVLTPASHYAEPFLRYLASDPHAPGELRIVHGQGRFSRQVAGGAEAEARKLGIRTIGTALPGAPPPGAALTDWALFSAGTFEEDIQAVQQARTLPQPPRVICSVAAGVREFSQVGGDPDGVFGIAQWFPGRGHHVTLGPAEDHFVAEFTRSAGMLPDYPAVQAAAGATLAVHCASLAGGTARELLWPAATALSTVTLFGEFQADPVSGTQIRHQTVLVRWSGGEPVPIR